MVSVPQFAALITFLVVAVAPVGVAIGYGVVAIYDRHQRRREQ